ncbi:MAG: Hpt domain-containing protein [Oscillospiraceae bacterium]|jgi:two-component system sensor histidine kinase/response regulator|nr:Hpt domain-containing protein [Oscillospiraceae bacterium]
MEEYTVQREDFDRYLDSGDALKRLGGNKMLLNTLLKKFLADGTEGKLKSAIAEGDQEGARAAAHTIKGLAGNLSLPALREAAAALEAALKAGQDTGDLPQRMYEISAKTAVVVNAVLAEG